MNHSAEYAKEMERLKQRRRFIAMAAAGTFVTAIGASAYVLLTRDPKSVRDAGNRLPPGQREVAAMGTPGTGTAANKSTSDAAAKTGEQGAAQQKPAEKPAAESAPQKPTRHDGRPTDRDRLPPLQTKRGTLKPMGGEEGNPSYTQFKLRVHGEVEKPFELSFTELLALQQIDLMCDVHCVTGWSLLDSRWLGVRVSDLAKKAGLKSSAKHVIFEAAHGYTANVPLDEALAPNVLVAHEHGGELLPHPHGGPVRALVPDLYFWKSAKWLTGVRFSTRDESGYWEVRGYHNHGNPWLEERYS